MTVADVGSGSWTPRGASAADPSTGYTCRATPIDAAACADPQELGADYVYLLGLYLGDGCISEAPRNVQRLRIFQDARYVELIDTCAETIRKVSDHDAGRIAMTGCVEIYAFWKHWACLFPQHGRGRKHLRSMALQDWQERLVAQYPRELVRGLIHSDGNRSINRIRRSTRDGVRTYEYPRYFFSNESSDIRDLFARACVQLGVSCSPTIERMLSVARRDSVAFLDSFIEPKR